jgi:pimeloyl-ACP methyl ester carboxylesterase
MEIEVLRKGTAGSRRIESAPAAGAAIRRDAAATAGAVLLLAACAPPGAAGGGPAMALSPCHLKGLSEVVECGTLEVFEDREAAAGRRIPLRVAVIPAVAATPSPDPLFILAGGPGQAATEIGPRLLPYLARVRTRRDIVLVDQRGTGGSNPLDCPEETGGGTAPDDLRRLFRIVEDEEALRRCLERLDADPRLYTTPIAMDDLDDVRRALGYDAINLYGGSYGTRAALVYMRSHPEAVRSAVLDGAAPPAIKLPLFMARDGERALRLAFHDCAADRACGKRFPDLERNFEELLRRLDEGPLPVRMRHPGTGRPVDLEITRDMFASHLRGALYDPELASLLPLVLERAAAGDLDPFIALGLAIAGGVAESISQGLFLSVVCAEDVPRIGDGERASALAGTFLGGVMLDAVEKACLTWPAGRLPPGYAEPVATDHPVLVLSGALDPATPPAWGEEVVRHLPRARHAVAAGAGHNVLPRGCAGDLVARFIEDGDAAGLDLSCLEGSRRPPFFLDPTGPEP